MLAALNRFARLLIDAMRILDTGLGTLVDVLPIVVILFVIQALVLRYSDQ